MDRCSTHLGTKARSCEHIDLRLSDAGMYHTSDTKGAFLRLVQSDQAKYEQPCLSCRAWVMSSIAPIVPCKIALPLVAYLVLCFLRFKICFQSSEQKPNQIKGRKTAHDPMTT